MVANLSDLGESRRLKSMLAASFLNSQNPSDFMDGRGLDMRGGTKQNSSWSGR